MFWAFLQDSIRFSTIFLFGSTGETITEKSGHLNLGVPGTMCMGALGGIIGVRIYLNSIAAGGQINPFLAVLIPLLFAILFGALVGLLYSFFTVTLRCNQNVTGLTITTLGVGFANFVGSSIDNTGFAEVNVIFRGGFAPGTEVGVFKLLFLSYGPLVYLAIAFAIATALTLRKTKVGLSLRAVGENPATADAAGINVTAYRYISTIIGSAIVALGGLFYIMDYIGGKWQYAIDAFGWLAVALVIFSVWSPDIGIAGAIIFGALYIAPNYINTGTQSYIKELIKMLPYVFTIVVLTVTSIVGGKKAQPPASLGLNYFREER